MSYLSLFPAAIASASIVYNLARDNVVMNGRNRLVLGITVGSSALAVFLRGSLVPSFPIEVLPYNVVYSIVLSLPIAFVRVLFDKVSNAPSPPPPPASNDVELEFMNEEDPDNEYAHLTDSS